MALNGKKSMLQSLYYENLLSHFKNLSTEKKGIPSQSAETRMARMSSADTIPIKVPLLSY